MFANIYLKVLCKGIYNVNDPVNNTSASVCNVHELDHTVTGFYMLNGIFNAQNLTSNSTGDLFYFTALGGVYSLNPDTYSANLLVNVNADVIRMIVEQYAINDTVSLYNEILL